MEAIVLYQPLSEEEVLEGEMIRSLSKNDLQSALFRKGVRLGKTQFYTWLMHCDIKRNRSGIYSDDDRDRLVYFALLMRRYGCIKTAKLKFHQRYPQQESLNNDFSTQQTEQTRTTSEQGFQFSNIASAFGF